MLDIQNTPDQRGIEIQQVGVKDVHPPGTHRHPKWLFPTSVGEDHPFGRSAPKFQRHPHMSRFMEVLVEWGEKPISGGN